MMTQNEKRRLRRKLFFGLGLLIIFCAILLAVMGYARTVVIQQSKSSNELLLHSYMEQEESRFNLYSSLLSLTCSYTLDMIKDGESSEQIKESLEPFTSGYNHLSTGNKVRCYAVIDGKFVGSDPSVTKLNDGIYNYRDSAWYSGAMSSKGEQYVTSVYKDYLTGDSCVTLSQRIKGTDDVLAVDLFYSEESMKDQSVIALPTGSSYYLCGKYGSIIVADQAHFRSPEKVQDAIYGLIREFPEDQEIFFIQDASEFFGVDDSAFVGKMDNGWLVVLTVPQSALLEQFSLMLNIIGVGMLIGFFLVIFLVWHDYQTEKKRQKAISKHDRLVKDKEILFKALESTQILYTDISYIDLNNDIYQEIYPPNIEAPQVGNYSEGLKLWTHAATVAKEDQDFLVNEMSIEAIKRDLAQSGYKEVRYRRTLPDSTQATILCTISVIERNPDGTPREVTLTARNIEQIIKKENDQRELLELSVKRAEDANLAKSKFLSSMSHDIRTPLNGILGMTAIARLHLDDPERVSDALSKITISGKHLLGLINGILDMSKIESGQLSLTEQPFSLNEMMELVRTLLRAQAQGKGLTLDIEEISIEHDMVIGDEQRLNQVLVNLAGNAIKFTPEGGHITFKVEEKPSNNSEVGLYEFTVADTGIGMESEFLEHIFEPFVRADAANRMFIEGSGLGMSIAKNIVDLMGGSINVESEVGKGTTFRVIVPIRKGSTEITHSPSKTEEASVLSLKEFAQHNYKGKRVLVVDEVDLNLEVISEPLRQVGLEVDVAYNGKEAIEKLNESEPGTYDLVFMDIQMPVMGGYEATRIIRSSSRKDIAQMPVIAMTANAFADDVAESRKNGMNDHLAKPVDLRALSRVLDTYLGSGKEHHS